MQKTNLLMKAKPSPQLRLGKVTEWIEYGGPISLIFIIYTIKDIQSSNKV